VPYRARKHTVKIKNQKHQKSKTPNNKKTKKQKTKTKPNNKTTVARIG
jgi:hypothetical protein